MKYLSKKYNNLIIDIGEIIKNSKNNIYNIVNTVLVETYRNIGRYIVKYEQKGEIRAEYGEKLLKKLSKDLIKNYGRGFSVANIERMRKFYIFYPNIENSASLMRKLTWTHIIRLLTIKDKNKRNFYMMESVSSNWSVRELNRQINSSIYERLALSKIKDKVPRKEVLPQIPEDILKDPYVLEFLGIKERSKYSENDLELAIIDNLEKFLLELGKGFAFVGRQYRISNGPDHYFIDLVFYNRLLRCFVLMDLKIGKLKHQDIGQMQMYVNYYDMEIKTGEENSTIGIILCKENDDFIVKYTIPQGSNIFTKEYKLYLPNKDDFRKILGKNK